MREFIFRGKRADNGEWIYGYYVRYDDIKDNGKDDCSYIIQKHNGEHFPFVKVISETIGQYTGQTDKHGKKIFEGDIVRGMMDWGPAGMLETVVDIGFKNSVGGYRWNYFDMDTVEVIGNVYDNPELLKGE